MKILTPNNYKEKNENATLKDYVSYLETKQREIETSLSFAKSMLLSESAIENIKNQMKIILRMIENVEQYMGNIVLHSIDDLSLEELKSYFKDDYKHLLEQIEEVKQKRNQIEEQRVSLTVKIEETLIKEGRAKKFYESEDTALFFALKKDANFPKRILENLLSDDLPQSLEKDIEFALLMECEIQNISSNAETITKIAAEIAQLLQNSREVALYSEEAKWELVGKLLCEESAFYQLLDNRFDVTTPSNIIKYLFQKITMMNTKFYTDLPFKIQKKLERERFSGDTYQMLFDTYQAFQNGEEVTLLEGQMKNNLETEKKEIEAMLEQLEQEKIELEKTMSNKDAAKEALKQKIKALIGEEANFMLETLKTIAVIEKDEQDLIEKIKNALSKLAVKYEQLEKSQAILQNPDYDNFFCAEERHNRYRIIHGLAGVNATEEVINPFLKTEIRRLIQYETMIDLENELDSYYATLRSLKEHSNFITRKGKKYKEKIEKLNSAYQKAIKTTFRALEIQDLFRICAPIISPESTRGNVICIKPNFVKIPSSFDKMNGMGRIQSFWNILSGIPESVQTDILRKYPKYASWEDYARHLMKEQSLLTDLLFTFSKDEEEYYHFASDSFERSQLLVVQNQIIDIVVLTYEAYKEARIELEPRKYGGSCDYEKKAELYSLLGSHTTISKSAVKTLIENIEKDIVELENYLLEHKDFCDEKGIELPPINEHRELERVETNFDSMIQSLDIEGIDTLSKAKAYKEFLQELSSFTLSSEEIKRFYLAKK